MKWKRRFRARLKAALRAWRSPVWEHYKPDDEVLIVMLPAARELFTDSAAGPEYVTNIIVNQVTQVAREATRRRWASLNPVARVS